MSWGGTFLYQITLVKVLLKVLVSSNKVIQPLPLSNGLDTGNGEHDLRARDFPVFICIYNYGLIMAGKKESENKFEFNLKP